MGKSIVFCADGTWNGPDQDEDGDHIPDPTNVFKLFSALAGNLSLDSINQADEQEKKLYDGGELVQAAKYIHGVGDSRNPIGKIIGGAFGAGIIARIVRGYTFLSRNYEAGDSITLVGFSRGAYTARALAGLVASQGLLARHLTEDREKAYRAGAQAWYRYREHACKKRGVCQWLVEALSDLPAFVSRNGLNDSDLVPVDSIKAVGVWDTVGALGLPNYITEPGADAFRFADTRLSDKVLNGFHATALDERRVDFIPSLWDPASNVVQVLFAGAHADVGGGYPYKNGESGLSDIALGWMIEQLSGVGLRFESPVFPGFAPDPLGVAHSPWLKWPFNKPDRVVPRDFSQAHIKAHPSILERAGKEVCVEPGHPTIVYSPPTMAVQKAVA